jgi:hypothetical protein
MMVEGTPQLLETRSCFANIAWTIFQSVQPKTLFLEMEKVATTSPLVHHIDILLWQGGNTDNDQL